jgi:hypothetical protein
MTVIPYSRTAHHRAAGPTRVDRALISAGTAIAAWGAHRAARRISADHTDQTAVFEGLRDRAARDLPMLPR